MVKKRIQKIAAIFLWLSLTTMLLSCQKNTAEPLVEADDNNFDSLLEEAKETDDSKVNAEDISKIQYGDYVTTLKNAEGDIITNINAKLEIPKAESFSVYSVKQTPITQEFTDKVVKEMFGDRKLYDGDAIEVISDIKAYLKDIDETGSNALKEVYRGALKELLNGFKLTDENVTLQDFPSDGKLKSPKDLYKDNSFYKWHNNMYGDGDWLCAITDGSDGNYTTIQVYNSDEKSNRIEVISNSLEHRTKLYSGSFSLDKETFEKHFGDIDKAASDPSNKAKPDNYYSNGGVLYYNPISYIPDTTESCTLSREEAISKADAFLQRLGIENFKCYDSIKENSELFHVSSHSVEVYRTAYKLTYYRNLDGVFLTQSSGDKNNLASNTEEAHNTKKYWHGEEITIRVNDKGIVHFVYVSPLEITEKKVENVSVKSFDEVKTYFENIKTAEKVKYEGYSYEYNIEKVRLSYSRISRGEGNADYQEGIVVPMWDFYGSVVINDQIMGRVKHDNISFLAVNAIDGTIIIPSDGIY